MQHTALSPAAQGTYKKTREIRQSEAATGRKLNHLGAVTLNTVLRNIPHQTRNPAWTINWLLSYNNTVSCMLQTSRCKAFAPPTAGDATMPPEQPGPAHKTHVRAAACTVHAESRGPKLSAQFRARLSARSVFTAGCGVILHDDTTFQRTDNSSCYCCCCCR